MTKCINHFRIKTIKQWNKKQIDILIYFLNFGLFHPILFYIIKFIYLL